MVAAVTEPVEVTVVIDYWKSGRAILNRKIDSYLSCALSNIMDCGEYDLPEAVILNNDNLTVDGKFIYAPIYMSMFIVKTAPSITQYQVDISGLR